jgi:hypothetical protein
VPRPVAARIARGIAELIAQERLVPPTRSADYLDYEPRLTALVGRTRRACTRAAAARTSRPPSRA